MKFHIYWTCKPAHRFRICEVLHVPRYMKVNGETDFTTDDPEVIEKLHDLERRKYIKLRNRNERA